jgi:restriction endonuclease S subunit
VFTAEGKSTIPHLTAEKLRAHRFPFPPADVQESIVEHLDEALQKSSLLRDRIREQLQAIEKYRDTLILSAVKGRLRE